MQKFPSSLAKALAVKRITKPAKLSQETLKEGIEASVTVAMNYDGAAIVQAIISNHFKGLTAGKVIFTDMNIQECQQVWDKINGKD